jgi:hypothetical protein
MMGARPSLEQSTLALLNGVKLRFGSLSSDAFLLRQLAADLLPLLPQHPRAGPHSLGR